MARKTRRRSKKRQSILEALLLLPFMDLPSTLTGKKKNYRRQSITPADDNVTSKDVSDAFGQITVVKVKRSNIIGRRRPGTGTETLSRDDTSHQTSRQVVTTITGPSGQDSSNVEQKTQRPTTIRIRRPGE